MNYLKFDYYKGYFLEKLPSKLIELELGNYNTKINLDNSYFPTSLKKLTIHGCEKISYENLLPESLTDLDITYNLDTISTIVKKLPQNIQKLRMILPLRFYKSFTMIEFPLNLSHLDLNTFIRFPLPPNLKSLVLYPFNLNDSVKNLIPPSEEKHTEELKYFLEEIPKNVEYNEIGL